MATWNVKGKTTELVLDLLDAFAVDVHVAAFEELTLGFDLASGSHDFIRCPRHDGRVLLAKPHGCYRACGSFCDANEGKEFGASHVLSQLQL